MFHHCLCEFALAKVTSSDIAEGTRGSLVGERGKQIINSRKSHSEHSENAIAVSFSVPRLAPVRISFISLRSASAFPQLRLIVVG